MRVCAYKNHIIYRLKWQEVTIIAGNFNKFAIKLPKSMIASFAKCINMYQMYV